MPFPRKRESSNHWPAFIDAGESFIDAGEYWDCAVKPSNDTASECP
jgi:hypothetical protein